MENCVRDAIHDVNINILWDYSSNERIALLVTRKSYFIGSKSDFVLKIGNFSMQEEKDNLHQVILHSCEFRLNWISENSVKLKF